MSFSIIINILIILLIISLIFLIFRIMITLDKLDKILDNVDMKLNQLNEMFLIINDSSGIIAKLRSTIISSITNFVTTLIKGKRDKNE